MEIIRTDSSAPEFAALVALLDADLAVRDGEEHDFYHQYNAINNIKHAIVLYDNGVPIACGAIKEFAKEAMEIKRMYTLPNHRGKGIASLVLAALEKWAAEIGYKRTVLETGKRQPEAIALYQKNGYTIIPNYGQYVGMENSVCFEKQLP